jgi:hypothetical protein
MVLVDFPHQQRISDLYGHELAPGVWSVNCFAIRTKGANRTIVECPALSGRVPKNWPSSSVHPQIELFLRC